MGAKCYTLITYCKLLGLLNKVLKLVSINTIFIDEVGYH